MRLAPPNDDHLLRQTNKSGAVANVDVSAKGFRDLDRVVEHALRDRVPRFGHQWQLPSEPRDLAILIRPVDRSTEGLEWLNPDFFELGVFVEHADMHGATSRALEHATEVAGLFERASSAIRPLV